MAKASSFRARLWALSYTAVDGWIYIVWGMSNKARVTWKPVLLCMSKFYFISEKLWAATTIERVTHASKLLSIIIEWVI